MGAECKREERRMVAVFDMKCVRKVLRAGLLHRIRIKDIRGRCGNKPLSWKERIKVLSGCLVIWRE